MSLRNTRLKWAWSEKPHSAAMSPKVACVERINTRARSIRVRITYACGVSFRVTLKQRQKCCGLKRTAWAISAQVIEDETRSCMNVFTFLTCHGARAPRTGTNLLGSSRWGSGAGGTPVNEVKSTSVCLIRCSALWEVFRSTDWMVAMSNGTLASAEIAAGYIRKDSRLELSMGGTLGLFVAAA
jgi:hypothetical protein